MKNSTLIIGPTCSGKTTHLNKMINKLDSNYVFVDSLDFFKNIEFSVKNIKSNILVFDPVLHENIENLFLKAKENNKSIIAVSTISNDEVPSSIREFTNVVECQYDFKLT